MRVAREQREGGETIPKRGQEQRGLWRSCRWRARWCGESANLQQTCIVLSMDARHIGALSGTSGDSLEMISTRFGTLGNRLFSSKRTKQSSPQNAGVHS